MKKKKENDQKLFAARIKGKQSAAHTEWKPVPHDTPEAKERAFQKQCPHRIISGKPLENIQIIFF
jgi:hypothetical protein